MVAGLYGGLSLSQDIQIARMGSGKVLSQTCWKMNVTCKVLQATCLGGGCVHFLWSLSEDERREIDHKGAARRTLNEPGKWTGDRE